MRSTRAILVGLLISSLVACSDSDDDGAASTATPSPVPTATPTILPPTNAEAAAGASELLESIAHLVCLTGGTPGGSVEVTTDPAGASLNCESFTGHNGAFSLVKYSSVDDAVSVFGVPGSEETVEERGGGLLREARQDCCGSDIGVQTFWKWQRECWVASGNTMDDTDQILTPVGPTVVDEIADSTELDGLLELCSDF